MFFHPVVAAVDLIRRMGANLLDGGLEGREIAADAQTADYTLRQRADVGMMAEGLTPVNIREMNLPSRYADGPDRVVDSHRRVRIRAGIDDQRIRRAHRLLDPGDELALMIALPAIDVGAEFACPALYLRHDFVEIEIAIVFGLAAAEHVQVGAVQDKNCGHWSDKTRNCALPRLFPLYTASIEAWEAYPSICCSMLLKAGPGRTIILAVSARHSKRETNVDAGYHQRRE